MTQLIPNAVHVKNDMPASIRCTGIHYKETQDLSVKQLALFIERDLHQYLKRIPVLEPSFTLSVIKRDGFAEIRVSITILYQNAVMPLFQRIENLLWSYNEQLFTQKDGRLQALPPRFQFKIEVIGRHGQVIQPEKSHV